MLFNSLDFLLFLAAVVLAYYLVPHRWRWVLLLAASYGFYVLWRFQNLWYLLLATASGFVCARLIGRSRSRGARRGALVAGLLINLGLLVFFKYADFLAGQVNLGLRAAGLLAEGGGLPLVEVRTPVGLSFYTFSVVTYLVDVYRGDMSEEPHAGRFALYAAFFPKIFAGPIERARTFLPQLRPVVRFDPALAVSGVQLIGWGLFKKVVIADNLAVLVNQGFDRPQFAPPIVLIIAAYLFAFQIYCDFSGYSDIAIGTSRLLGLRLMDNFRRPYLSVSTAEFWGQRWHISLATWFRDYMYIPLGGSRVSWPRHYFNIMMVFAVSGLWHAGLGYGVGWNFLVWGALNGLYQWVGLTLGRAWKRLGGIAPGGGAGAMIRVVRVVLTFHLITFAWIFFRAGSVGEALVVVQRIWASLGMLPRFLRMYPFTAEHYTAAALVVGLIVVEVLDERRSMWERLQAAPVAVRWATYYLAIGLLLVLGRWQAEEFIYMQF